MDPIASPLSANTLSGLAPMVNNVAIRLGLLPFQGGEIRLEDDYGVIAQRLVQVITGTLARGWWFNTKYRVKLTVDDYSEIDEGYTLPYLVISSALPRFGEGDQPSHITTVANATRDATILKVLDKNWNVEKPFEVDLITSPIGQDYDQLPSQFAEYVVSKTAEEISPYFGAAVNPNETDRTWHELLRANADARPTDNMIDDNPINWMTTRRR